VTKLSDFIHRFSRECGKRGLNLLLFSLTSHNMEPVFWILDPNNLKKMVAGMSSVKKKRRAKIARHKRKKRRRRDRHKKS
jgi:hypothetical protein